MFFCILFYLFIFSTLRELFESGARNVVDITEMLKCCVASYWAALSVHQANGTHRQHLHTHTHAHKSTHTAIPAHPHIHLNLHMEGFIRRTCDPWMGYVFSLFLWRVDVFLNISLSHSYQSVIFLMNYMNFYKKETELQSYNRVNWCRRIYLTMVISSKIKCSSSVKRLL